MGKLDRCEEKEAFWRMVLDEHRGSGLNIRQFCRREGLRETSFYFWRREIGNRDQQGDSAVTGSKMIPVKIIEPTEGEPQKCQAADSASSDQAASATGGLPIEVITPAGFVIRSGRCDAVTTDAVVRLAHALANQDQATKVAPC